MNTIQQAYTNYYSYERHSSTLSKITGEEWSVLTKEILEEAAEKLDLHPKKIEYVFESKEKSTWDEVFSAMASKYYKSDKQIKKTVADVVQAMARRGNCVIVGRGGVILTHDIEKSLHLKLQAPLEWRAKQLQTKHGGKLSEMKKDRIIKRIGPDKGGYWEVVND